MASAGEEKWQSYSFRNWSRSGWYLTQRWVHGGKLMKLVLGAIVVYPCFPQAVSFEDRTWGTWQLLLHGMRHFAKLRVSETILCYERAFNSAHFVLRVLLCWWTLQKTIIDLIVLIHSTYIGLTDSPAYHFHSSRLLSIYCIVYRDSLFWSWGSGIYDASNSTRHREWQWMKTCAWKSKTVCKPFVKWKFKKITRNHGKFTSLNPWYVPFPKACTSPTPARAMSQVLRIMELFQVASWRWPLGPYWRCYLKDYVITAASSMFVFVWHRNWRLSSSASRPSLFLATDRCKMIQSRYVKIPSPNPSHGV